MDFLSKWLQNLLIPVLYVVFMHQPPQVRKSHAKFSLISLPGKGASHANRYLEVPTTSPVCSLLICSSIVFNSPGIGGKEDTGKQVLGCTFTLAGKMSCQNACLCRWCLWPGALKMNCWSVDPCVELVCCILTSHITSSCRAEAGWSGCKVTAIASQHLRGDAAVRQLEEAARREFFSSCLTGKKPTKQSLSQRTENLALCTAAHLLYNILTPCLCFLFLHCRLGECIRCR